MSDSAEAYILDSYALLTYFGGEVGEARVKEILHNASIGESHVLMSLINLGEVVYITERERSLIKAQEILAIIEQLPIEILPVDRQTVLAAAHIKANYPVASTDAFAVIAAQAHEGVLLTGDPEFTAVKDLIQIERIDEQRGT